MGESEKNTLDAILSVAKAEFSESGSIKNGGADTVIGSRGVYLSGGEQ